MAPNLPPLAALPTGFGVNACAGFIYAKLFRTDTAMTTAVFAIYDLSKRILYHTFNRLLSNGEPLNSHKVYLAVFSISHSAFIIALSHFNMIKQPGIFLLSTTGLIVAARRISWIYSQEQLENRPN